MNFWSKFFVKRVNKFFNLLIKKNKCLLFKYTKKLFFTSLAIFNRMRVIRSNLYMTEYPYFMEIDLHNIKKKKLY